MTKPVTNRWETLLPEASPYESFRLSDFTGKNDIKKVGENQNAFVEQPQNRDEFVMDTGQRLYIKSLIS